MWKSIDGEFPVVLAISMMRMNERGNKLKIKKLEGAQWKGRRNFKHILFFPGNSVSHTHIGTHSSLFKEIWIPTILRGKESFDWI